MSSKDKTRDKLLGSMRRTKAVANEPEKVETPAATNVKPEVKKAVKKEPRKPSKTTQKEEEKVDYFQSVHRVWPD